MLLNEYWDESYWPSCGRLRECTRVGYASAWRRHIRPGLGDMDLADLTGPRIQSWLDSITPAGAARKVWAVLRQMQIQQSQSFVYIDERVESHLETAVVLAPEHSGLRFG